MSQIAPLLWPAAVMAACSVAAWRGHDDERLAAGVVLAAWALSLLLFRTPSVDAAWGMVVLELGALGFLVALALSSRRYWPLFAAAFQLLTALGHLLRAIDPAGSPTAAGAWAYLVVLTIGWAAWSAPPGAMRR